MRVIPVIDVLNGRVVRGIGGRRDEYRPIQSQIAADSRPATVAQTLVERFGFDTVYVADLDAIMHGRLSVEAWWDIAGTGLKLWLDAGITDHNSQQRILDALQPITPEFQLVVGLESLDSVDALVSIIKAWDFPIVSLDLKAGLPLTKIEGFKTASPVAIARTLYDDCGVREVIVLDLADVGASQGASTLHLCEQLAALPNLKLIAGGGVRGVEDLRTIAAVGCSAALVASALHDGRLTREDLGQVVEARTSPPTSWPAPDRARRPDNPPDRESL